MTRTKRIRSVIALAILASISFPPGAAATDFAKAKFYPVGTNPFVIVTGDFNGDGKLDMAVVNIDSSDVSILLGNGDGTFQAAKNIAIAGGVGPIVTGDFNGDHKLDLAVGSDTNATLLLGNGDGTFRSPIQINVDASSLLAADFNQDGKMDLLTPAGVLLGNGDGTFQPPHGQGIDYAFEVADFNGDSKPDVLSRKGVFLGNGDGTFQPPRPLPTLCNFPDSCGFFDFAPAADFNGDRKLDLAVTVARKCLFCDKPTFSVEILFGKGDGTFQSPVDLGIGDQYVTAGDFNGDGKMDLASTPSIYQGSSLVHVLLGKGDGTFPSQFTVDSKAGPDFILVADVNGDGLADLLLADPADNLADVLLNTSPTSGADLSVSVAASPEPVSVTQQLSYTIYAINSGPKDATNFTLKDALPSGVTFVSSSNTQGSCLQSSLVLTCSLEKLVSGDSITASIIVVPNSPGTATNSANVAATEPDPDMTNNSSSHSTRVDPMFTLTVTKSGTGTGSVTDSTGDLRNFNCGNVCSVSLPTGTQAYISTNPDAGSVFAGWGGACASSGLDNTCFLTMNADQKATAGFDVGPNFFLSVDTTSLALSPGTSVTTNISIAPEGGPNNNAFNNPVTLSCSVAGSAQLPTCSLSSASVTPGTNPASSTLTITAPLQSAARARVQPPHSFDFLLLGPWLTLAVILVSFILLPAQTLPQKRGLCLLSGFLLAAVFLQLGCGGSGGNASRGGPQVRNYTVTVTAVSGSISKSVPIAVTVQ
jgi:uncharacterized repeat protein (TIGR01451 family)